MLDAPNPKKYFTTRIWILNIKPTLTGMLNEWKQTRPNCKVEAIQTLLVIWGERIPEEAEQNARLKAMKDCAQKDRLRTRQSKENDSAQMPPQKRDGAIIRNPPNPPLNCYPRNKRATRKPRRL